MNNMPFQFFPGPINVNNRLEEEIIKLKQEIAQLKERLAKLENKNKNDYLEHDDNFYMM